MARKPRIEYPGAVYHVLSRGDRKNIIFKNDSDRSDFIRTLSEACCRQGWFIHAYVLMDNHYHLLLETPEPNLVSGMKWLQGTYTQRFNIKHGECGHLFQGRYKAILIQPDQGDYFRTVAAYIHFNPVRGGLINLRTQDLKSFKWSSLPFYFNDFERPDWLQTERVVNSYHLPGTPAGHRDFEKMMNAKALMIYNSDSPATYDIRWATMHQGWCLGDSEFEKSMLQLADKHIRQYERRSYLGFPARKHDEQEAERLLCLGQEYFSLSDDKLTNLKKSDPRKTAIAWLIRRNTSVKNQWICTRLSMGCPSNLARYVDLAEHSENAELVRFRRSMTKKAF